MKTIFSLCIALLLGVTLSAQDFLGSWIVSGTTPDGQAMQAKLSFAADGSFTVDLNNDGNVDINGTYTVDGAEVTMQDDGKGERPCGFPGTYKFTVDGDNLKKEVVKDDCDGRRETLKAATITRAK